MRTVNRIAACFVAAACTIATSAAAVAATQPRTILVDDDRAQCADAAFATIAEAVTSANPGDTVQVCPGLYPQFVRIDRPLTLVGTPGAIETYDCFASAPSQAGDLDPARYAVLTRPPGAGGDLLTVASGGVTVAGLVLEGAVTPGVPADSISAAAIRLLPESAGARVHHNLIRDNSLGIDLGSDGTSATRVHHNCLRDNRWGMASQRQDFVGGTIDHNQSFRHAIFAYGVGDLAPTRATVFTKNISREDARGFWVLNSPNSPAAPTRITKNHIADARLQGVFVTPDVATSTAVVVTGNEISGTGGTSHTVGLGIAVASNSAGTPAVDGVEIANNTLTYNAVGVSVILTNPGIQVHDNTSNANRQYGIRARFGAPGTPAFGATFTDNTMLGNGLPPFGTATGDADAFDNTFQGDQSPNIWTGNVCEHDLPVGKICGTD